MDLYYNRKGEPISHGEWVALFQEERHIARERIGCVEVSTVFIGLNHNYGSGPPLIYETMIFGGERDQYCVRYATEEQARVGHHLAVTLVKGEQDAVSDS